MRREGRTPCDVCPKTEGQEVRSRARAVEIGAAFHKAYQRYREWRATGRFPDDPIVLRVAAIFRGEEDAATSARGSSAAEQLLALLLGTAGKGR